MSVLREYYIYTHSDGDEIVYIGRGVAGRAWVTNLSVNAHNRSEEHHDFMIGKLREGDASFVSIVEESLTFEESKVKEALLIESHGETRFNIIGSKAHKQRLSEIGKRVTSLNTDILLPYHMLSYMLHLPIQALTLR